MNEECRFITKKDYVLLTKEEYDKYVDTKNCRMYNERLRLENVELRELLKLIGDELEYCDTLSFTWNPIQVRDRVHRIQLLIFKQLNKENSDEI